MSHVTTLDLHIKDLACLAAAAKAIGAELVQGQTSYKWFGKHVGDYPLPQGFAAKDLGQCAHAIRIPGRQGAYEVGVVERRDGKPGFTLLWDFWAGGYGLQDVIGSDGVNLRNHYCAQVSVKEMKKKGYRASILKTDKGLKVVCTK